MFKIQQNALTSTEQCFAQKTIQVGII